MEPPYNQAVHLIYTIPVRSGNPEAGRTFVIHVNHPDKPSNAETAERTRASNTFDN